MAAAAGHYYGDGGRATKRQKTDSDGMATVLSFDSVYCIFHACGARLSFSLVKRVFSSFNTRC